MEKTNQQSTLRNTIASLAQLILNSVWIFWLGGLTFYMAIVVPIGGDILGGATQGAVTARVTGYLNAFGLASVFLMIAEGWLKGFRWQLILAIAMLAPQLALIWLRSELTLILINKPSILFDGWEFYSAHRIYLWTQTLLWTLAVAIESLKARRAKDLRGSDSVIG